MPTPSSDSLPTYEQPERSYRLASGARTLVVEKRGDYDELAAALQNMSHGDDCPEQGYTNLKLREGVVERERGGVGHLTLTYVRGTPTSHGDGDDDVAVRWRLTSCPEDVSVYRYCGPSVGANANRARIDSWRRRLDERLESVGDETVGDSEFFEGLTSADQQIARKLLEGKDTVQRHYPMIVKVSEGEVDDLEMTGELDHAYDDIDDAPEIMTDRAAKWLKVQEDLEIDEETEIGTLTEGWIGGVDFDEDFYGESPTRWEFGTI